MKKILSLILSIMLLLTLFSCKTEQSISESNQEPSSIDLPSEPSSIVAATEPEYYSISLITDGTYDYYYRMKAGCEQAVEDLKEKNINISFSYDPPEHNMMPGAWVFEDMVKNGFKKKDAILYTPTSPKGYEYAFKAAHDKSIKTILLDSTVENDYWDAAYMSNYYNDGKIAALEMIKQLEKDGIYSGKICLINGHNQNDWNISHEEGFRTVLEGSNYELMETYYSDGDLARVNEYLEKLLKSDEWNDVIGIVGFWGDSVNSISEMMKNKTKSDADFKIPLVVLFNIESPYLESEYPERYNGFEKGVVDISINTDPYQMGYQGIMGAVELLRGNEIDPKIVDVAPVVVTSDNCLQYFAEVDSQVKSARGE